MTSRHHSVLCLKGEELDKRLHGPFTCETHAAGEGGVLNHLTVVINNHLEGEGEILSKYACIHLLSTQRCLGCMFVLIHTWIGFSGLEEGAMVQMMLSLERGLEVKKEQGSTTKSP